LFFNISRILNSLDNDAGCTKSKKGRVPGITCTKLVWAHQFGIGHSYRIRKNGKYALIVVIIQ
jgi:hypothetical protein